MMKRISYLVATIIPIVRRNGIEVIGYRPIIDIHPISAVWVTTSES